MSNAPKPPRANIRPRNRRRLTDLYARGKEHAFDDGEGEVKVWVSKISPLEEQNAAKSASASRAIVLSLFRKPDPDPEQLAPYWVQIEDYGLSSREAKIDLLILPELNEQQVSAEEELAAEDEWKEEGYLDSLYEAWEAGAKETYALDPEDEEASRIFSELKRFSDQVEQRLAGEKEYLAREYEDYTDEELEREVIKRLAETDANNVFVTEFRKWQVFYATRELDDHEKYYFKSKDEVDRLQAPIIRELLDVYQDLTVDPLEGKDSADDQTS